MLRVAYLLCGNRHRAEDAVAEVFAKMYRRWRRGRIDHPRAYLRRAVVNEVNSRFRRLAVERREASRRHGDDRGARTADETFADRSRVLDALAILPTRQRTAVVGSQELVLYNHHGEPDGSLRWEDTGLSMVAIGHRRDQAPSAFYAVRARGDTLELARSQDVTTSVRLPAGLVVVDGHAAETERVWMSARGDDVLLGDGSGRAWRIVWTAEGWGELYEVDGSVRYGVPLEGRR